MAQTIFHENINKSSSPAGILPENAEKQQENALDPSMLLPDSGTFWRLDERFIATRDTTQSEIIRRVQRGEGFFVSGASHGRKETNAKHTSYWRAFSLRIDNISKSKSLFGLLSLLPPPMKFPDKKGHAYLVWLLDRDYSREEFNAGIESLREQIEGIATITPMIPVNPKVLSLKPSSCVSLSVFQKAIEKGVRLLEEAKVGNMAQGAPESLMEKRNDSKDASMAVEGVEGYEEGNEEVEADEQCAEVFGLGELEMVQDKTVQEMKCRFASTKSLEEVKVYLSIYRRNSDTEPEQMLGVSVAQALGVCTNKGTPYLTQNKSYAPYWAGEMKSTAWTGETKKKKDNDRAELCDTARQAGFDVPEEGIQRSGRHCVGASLVKLDLDDISAGDFEALKAKIEASGLEVVIYTTYSHGAENKGNRYRVVFVLDRQASVAEFEVVSKFIGLEMLGRTYDASEHKAYQLAGVWAVHPDRRASAQHWPYTGAAVSVDKVLTLAGGAEQNQQLASSGMAGDGLGAGAGVCAVTKSLMNFNSTLESKDPLPVWDAACYKTLWDALTHPEIKKYADPDYNDSQVKVLAALKRSVAITQDVFPDQAVVAEERCRALYLTYAAGNTRGYDSTQIEKDWNGNAIGGMDKISPFYIVSIANQLGISTAHITNGGALAAGRIHKAVEAEDDASELLPANGEKVTATLYGMTSVLFKRTREVGLRLAFDEFSGTEVISDWNQNSWRPFADADYVDIRLRLERLFFKKVSQELVKDAVAYVTSKIRIDTAKIWAESLPAWDGVKRVDGFFENYFGCENGEYHTEVARFIWTALAGRVLVPGLKVDMAPILCGEQGLRKSTAVSVLSPCEDYFSELDFATSEKERKRTIKGKLVIELAELSGMKKTDKEALKRFLVATFDEYVPHYKEKPVRYPRRCLFIGTTNHDDFLNDETGNRRYLPIRVSQISVYELKRDRNQLWAEGIALFKQLGVLYAKAEELAVLEHPNFETDDAIGEAVEKAITSARLYDGKGEASALKDCEYIKLDDVLVVMGIDNAQKQRLQGAVVKGLKKLGYVSRQKRIVAGENPSRVWMLDKKAV